MSSSPAPPGVQSGDRLRWSVPAAVIIGILAVTSWPKPPALPHNSDKVVHFASYALLGAAIAWAARVRRWPPFARWVACVALFGALDEWHQQFIPNRRMDSLDWIADVSGAVTGLFLVTARHRRREFVA